MSKTPAQDKLETYDRTRSGYCRYLPTPNLEFRCPSGCVIGSEKLLALYGRIVLVTSKASDFRICLNPLCGVNWSLFPPNRGDHFRFEDPLHRIVQGRRLHLVSPFNWLVPVKEAAASGRSYLWGSEHARMHLSVNSPEIGPVFLDSRIPAEQLTSQEIVDKYEPTLIAEASIAGQMFDVQAYHRGYSQTMDLLTKSQKEMAMMARHLLEASGLE